MSEAKLRGSNRIICATCSATYVGESCLMCEQNNEYELSMQADRASTNQTIPADPDRSIHNNVDGDGNEGRNDDGPRNEQGSIHIDVDDNGNEIRNDDGPRNKQDTTIEDEVWVLREVTIHRLLLKTEILQLFMQHDSLNYHYKFKILDPRGEEEMGIGDGVTRDVFCSFWCEFMTSCTLGCIEKVPSIRHDMSNLEWEAVGRILLYGFRVSYFPLRLSSVFIMSALFGETCITTDNIITAFQQYVNEEERESITNMFKDYNKENEEALLETLSAYQCYRSPSKDNLTEIIKELGHQELIQKPRYVADSIYNVFRKSGNHPFKNVTAIQKFYEEKAASNRKVIKCLKAESELSHAQEAVFNHLYRYIRSLTKKDLTTFLRFVTGGDLLPEKSILVSFTSQVPRCPRSRTCVPMLILSEDYDQYNVLAEEFEAVLSNPDSFRFSVG